MSAQIVELDGRKYAILPVKEYERLSSRDDEEMPEFPKPNRKGNYPATEYIRVSIARDIIQERRDLGLSQAELARRAGIRIETLNRLERGKTTPDVATVAKIDRALRRAEKSASTGAAAPSRQSG